MFTWFSRLLCVVLVVLLTGCGAKDNTPIPKSLVQFKPVESIQTLWSTGAGSGTVTKRIVLGLSQDGSTVYATGHDGRVSAINQKTGDVVWKASLDRSVSTPAGVGDGLAVVGTIKGELIALDAQNGKVLWQKTMPSSILAKPLVANQKVYVHVHNGNLMALDAKTGKVLWRYFGSEPTISLIGDSAPVMADNWVICGFNDGELVALSADTGHVKWNRPIAIASGSSDVARMVDVTASPVVDGNVVYAVSYQGNIAAIDLASGNLIWQHPMSSYQGLAVSPTMIFVTDEQSHIWGLDKKTGKVLWVQPQLEARSVTAPVVTDSAVVVGDYKGYLYWLSQTDGHFLARVALGGRGILSQAITKGNEVYVITNSGEAYALKAQKHTG